MAFWNGRQTRQIATNRDFSFKTGSAPSVFFLFSLFLLWGFGFETVGKRLYTELDGTVVSSRDIPPTRGPRYAPEYLIRGHDGRDTLYVAGPTDASLPRSMPTGTYLKKQRWSLGYERNGQHVDDFSSLFYTAILSVALALFVWSLRSWLDQSKG